MARTHTSYDSPIGRLTLVAADGDLCGLYFPDHWHPPAAGDLGAGAEEGFEPVEAQLSEYFAGRRQSFELETVLAGGSGFQRRVWSLLASIPYGETTTYGEIAAELGDGAAAREVGAAVGRNPISVIVPCHRVVGKDGSLTGYAGGLERKRHLLELESPAAQLML
jgi:methylated-DNA-[protein]-cysteine S-methyltransferase